MEQKHSNTFAVDIANIDKVIGSIYPKGTWTQGCANTKRIALEVNITYINIKMYKTVWVNQISFKPRRGSPVYRRPSTAEAPPIGKIHPFLKIAVTLEPLMRLGCHSTFRISYKLKHSLCYATKPHHQPLGRGGAVRIFSQERNHWN